MKRSLATGVCLSVILCVGLGAADEIQWRAAPSSPPAPTIRLSGNPVTQAAPPPAIFMNAPTPLSSGPDSDFFRPAAPLVRAQIEDDSKPLPSGIVPGQQFPMGMPIVTETIQTPEPKTNSGGRGVPMPMQETIPVSPTPLGESVTILDGSAPVVSGGGCGCGMGTMGDVPIWGDGAGCGCGTSCGGCCTDACCTDAGCMKGCCADGCCCWNSNRNNMWISAEYLLWTFSRPNTPPLVTGGPNPAALPLGAPGNQVLYGQNNLDTAAHSGGRIDFGFWFPNCCNWGIEFSGLFLGSNTTSYTAGGSGFVGRPFTNVTGGYGAGFPSYEPVNDPTIPLNGTVRVDYTSRAWGLEANMLYKICCGPNWRLNFLFGYRNFQLDEGISITENLNAAGAPFVVNDSFTTHNSFNGGQIGFEGEWRFCKRFFLGGFIKTAIGDVYQSVSIAGSGLNTSAFGLGPTSTGVFAASSNIGNYSRNQLGVLPEACLKIGMDVTDNLRIFVGYNVLFLSGVTRPGDAIDPVINANNAVSNVISQPARPAFVFTNSTFWAQGLTAGLEYHY